MLKGKQFATVKYEELHSLKTTENKINFLINKLKLIGLDVTINKNKLEKIDLLEKQDTNNTLNNKINNYNEFINYIKANNLSAN